MIVKALKSFVGVVSMNIDEVKNIVDNKLAEELIRAGHVIEVKSNNVPAVKLAEKLTEKEKPAEETAEKTVKKKKKK